MKIAAVFSVCCITYVISFACPADISSAGVVMNDGEYSDFERIESLGREGESYLKEIIPGQTTSTDTTTVDSVVMKEMRRRASPLSATLVSSSFRFDPDADSSFMAERQFAFNNDTLVVHDYWALVDQPEFGCSLSVANDTLYISYLPHAGVVNDWMPTVETVLKIKFTTFHRTIVCCFNEVKNHARSPQPHETGFGDATEKRYTALPVPPLATYKYRAHRYPSAMVFLSYERHGMYRLTSPRITVTFDSAAMMMDSTPFASLLMEELQWLSAEGICTPSPRTIGRLEAMGQRMSGGWCYWTRQDSVIGINQWFDISSEGIYSTYSMRSAQGGCGLGTDFQLPSQGLKASGTAFFPTVPSATFKDRVAARVSNGSLSVTSSESFDKMAVFDLLGHEIFSVKLVAPVNTVSVPFGSRFIPGSYIVSVGLSGSHAARGRGKLFY